MIGLFTRRSRDYYVFCTTAEIQAFETGEVIKGNIYVAEYDPKTRQLYKLMRKIAVRLIHEPTTPEIKLQNKLLHFFIPYQYFQPFEREFSVSVCMGLSGEKLQIIDYERCKYPICAEAPDLLVFEK